AAARCAAREAVAAAAARHSAAGARRLAEVGRDRPRLEYARRGRGLAGGIASRRADAVGRFRRHRVRAAPGGTRARPRGAAIALRARITAVRGREVNLETYEQVRGRGSLSREYTITYRPQLNANEELLQGQWWNAGPSSGEAEVSIEESLQQRFRINIGDQMQFDVLGRTIPARVTSIRKVNWRDYRSGGFMIVFRPGPFDNAPHSYISSVNGPRDPVARSRMQAALLARYPNVSVIDLREVLDTIQTIVDGVTLGVTVVGGLVLFSGMLILVG